MEGKKLQTMNLIPMYALFDLNVYDCLYTTNLKEYLSYPVNNVTKHCTCFYVHKTQDLTQIQSIEFTVQVGMIIYIVRGGEAELNQYLPWTQYEGIEGGMYTVHIKLHQ